MDLQVTAALLVPEGELEWSFARSGGPGGQNVNKVASKAVLRWHLADNTSLPVDLKDRLRAQQRGRLTTEGDLLVTSTRTRDQDRNRQDCLEKLANMIRQAAVVPKVRRPTRPGRAAKARRLANKKHRSATKAGRRARGDE